MDAQSRLHVGAVLVTLTTVALTIFNKRWRRRARVHRQSLCQRPCRLGDQLDNVKFHLRKCENCVSIELFRLWYLLVRAKKPFLFGRFFPKLCFHSVFFIALFEFLRLIKTQRMNDLVLQCVVVHGVHRRSRKSQHGSSQSAAPQSCKSALDSRCHNKH